MPRLHDLVVVRAILETDRVWSAYALGDLTPGFVEHSEWYGAGPHPRSIVLLYRRSIPAVLFSIGPDDEIAATLRDLPRPLSVYLSIPVAHLALVDAHARIEQRTAMWRMVLEPSAFPVERLAPALQLSTEDLPALQGLFRDGQAQHEAPDFFEPWMVKQGVYFGVFEQGSLVAAAGTHLVAEQTGVAAIGNVYTRRDRRGLGLAHRTTGAVAAALLARGIATIVLNVNQKNAAALNVYESLGFRRHCAFWEGTTGLWRTGEAARDDV